MPQCNTRCHHFRHPLLDFITGLFLYFFFIFFFILPCFCFILQTRHKNAIVHHSELMSTCLQPAIVMPIGLALPACPPQQKQLNSSFDDETAALLNDCYTLEEKERLKEEWRLFEEQKGNFERERKNFTEAAIRLGHEVGLLWISGRGCSARHWPKTRCRSRQEIIPPAYCCRHVVLHVQQKPPQALLVYTTGTKNRNQTPTDD